MSHVLLRSTPGEHKTKGCVIGLYDRKAGVRANREFVAALLGRKVALHLDLVARKANDARAGRREILGVFGKFMRLDRADARESAPPLRLRRAAQVAGEKGPY